MSKDTIQLSATPYTHKDFENTKELVILQLDTEYVTCPVDIITDKKINNTSFRILMFLWSQPDNYIISKADLITRKFGSKNFVNKCLSELEESKYLVSTRIKNNYKRQAFNYSLTKIVPANTPTTIIVDGVNSRGSSGDTLIETTVKTGLNTRGSLNEPKYNNIYTTEHKDSAVSSLEKDNIMDIINKETNNKFNTLKDITIYLDNLNTDQDQINTLKRMLEYILESNNMDTLKELIKIVTSISDKEESLDIDICKSDSDYKELEGSSKRVDKQLLESQKKRQLGLDYVNHLFALNISVNEEAHTEPSESLNTLSDTNESSKTLNEQEEASKERIETIKETIKETIIHNLKQSLTHPFVLSTILMRDDWLSEIKTNKREYIEHINIINNNDELLQAIGA